MPLYGPKSKIFLPRLFILFNKIFSLNKKGFLNKKYILVYGTKSKIFLARLFILFNEIFFFK
jgi:hypothetical protein